MSRKGFTLIEMVVVLAVVAVLAAILFPTIARHITDAKITRVVNEEQVITASIMMLYKDTGKWPNTNAAGTGGPTGNSDRLLSGEVGDPVATDAAAVAQTGAAYWGSYGDAQQLYNFLYLNNPNCTGSPNGASDYPTEGEFSWRGPYLDKMIYHDPWGYQYVVSSRYFPPNSSVTLTDHRVLVISSGKDHMWSTAYSDTINRLSATPADAPYGPYADGADDIGVVIMTNK
ncbi:MAG: prepilin-type N-terminal cleavage/methylation domain-containing protein [bacterium]|nr:prepilin-type N-terminal cleavage/methylation domain-containing protein [bacterium]